jgi:hypothetical protein
MTVFFQDAAVTGLALAALVLLVRRVTGVLRPSRSGDPCASCPSATTKRPARTSPGRRGDRLGESPSATIR